MGTQILENGDRDRSETVGTEIPGTEILGTVPGTDNPGTEITGQLFLSPSHLCRYVFQFQGVCIRLCLGNFVAAVLDIYN